MFPMDLDHNMLNSLPLPGDQSVKRVIQALQSILAQKIIPYFRNHRGSDLIHLARVKQELGIYRLEDEENRVRLVSLLTRSERGRSIWIHERFFDYLAFILPAKPDARLGETGMEERKIVTVAEFLLRHQVEHILYPERSQEELIRSDVEFAYYLQKEDPTAYRVLRAALQDEMNGLLGGHYLELIDKRGQEEASECVIGRMVSGYVDSVRQLPRQMFLDVVPWLDADLKSRVIGECYKKTQGDSVPLVQRARNFQKIIQLFAILIRTDARQAEEVFGSFKDRWGAAALFHELDIPEKSIDLKSTSEQFDILGVAVKKLTSEPARQMKHEKKNTQEVRPVSPIPAKSLKDRIEDARNNASVPASVMELIDKNKMNAAGQSGAKYTELMETLLAIPWGVIKTIDISQHEFESALNETHYGLKKPKELICDFFANLIWRYQHFDDSEIASWKRTGSSFLLVGPPGVGKTSLAISIAKALGIPYHKMSLGGMKDEADIRGYGFTYEGSKPGPIIQGLIKMGVMNGMFILDEADKTEKFAIATLLEILDPEQNHLYHDKYTQSTVDVDLSNCHFILTANSLETVPSPILNRCEVVFLDRYSIEEKTAIARDHLLKRVCDKYMIPTDEIFFDPEEETDLFRYLIRNYTSEAGVRDLERIIRTLFLRLHRKEIMAKGQPYVRIRKRTIREHLEEPNSPRHVNEEDRVGETMGLGVNMEAGMGSLIPIQVTPVGRTRSKNDPGGSYLSMVHATGNLEKVMDESRKVAATAIQHVSEKLGIDAERAEESVHMHFMGGSTKKDGPSAGGAIALALASLYTNRKVRRDVAMTGEIDTQGRITGIGGLSLKLETAYGAGCKTLIIPRDNLSGTGGIDRLPEALKQELQILTYKDWKGPHEPYDYTRHVMQVVAVDDILQASDVALIDQPEIDELELGFVSHAQRAVTERGNEFDPQRCLKLVLMSDPDDFDPELFMSDLCQSGPGVALLVPGEIMGAMSERLRGFRENVVLRRFDPPVDQLSDVIREIVSKVGGDVSQSLRLSVIAPLDFLVRHPSEKGTLKEQNVEMRIMASTCTLENLQFDYCRTILSRVYHHLTSMNAAVLEDCPFLVNRNGYYTISLSFIPEKYRLDARRSEEILHRCLTRWLDVMERESGKEEKHTALAG